MFHAALRPPIPLENIRFFPSIRVLNAQNKGEATTTNIIKRTFAIRCISHYCTWCSATLQSLLWLYSVLFWQNHEISLTGALCLLLRASLIPKKKEHGISLSWVSLWFMSPWSTYQPKSCNPSVLPKLWMPWLMKLRSSGTKSHIIRTDIPYFFEKDLKIAGVLVVCGTPVRVSDSTLQHICWQLQNPKASKTPHLILPWDSYSFLWNTLWGLLTTPPPVPFRHLHGNTMTGGHQVSPPVWPTVWSSEAFSITTNARPSVANFTSYLVNI